MSQRRVWGPQTTPCISAHNSGRNGGVPSGSLMEKRFRPRPSRLMRCRPRSSRLVWPVSSPGDCPTRAGVAAGNVPGNVRHFGWLHPTPFGPLLWAEIDGVVCHPEKGPTAKPAGLGVTPPFILRPKIHASCLQGQSSGSHGESSCLI